MTLIYSNTLNDFVNTQLTKSSSSLVFADGISYKGEIKNNQPCGFGTFTWPNNEVFQGFHQHGMRNNIGYQKWSDGDIYIGEFYNDKRHGWGLYRWANHDKYEGSFYEDLRHGFGIYTSNNNNRYVGTFYNNKREGFGTFYYENGNIFQGLYKDNYRCGPGILQYTDGRQDIGLWHRNSIIKLIVKESEVFTIKQFSDLVTFYSNSQLESQLNSQANDIKDTSSQFLLDHILRYKITKPSSISSLENQMENLSVFPDDFTDFLKMAVSGITSTEDLISAKGKETDLLNENEKSPSPSYNEDLFQNTKTTDDEVTTNLCSTETLKVQTFTDPHQDETRKEFMEADSTFDEIFSKILISNNITPILKKIINHLRRFSSYIPIKRSDTEICDMTDVVKDIVSNIFFNFEPENEINRKLKYNSPGDFESRSELLISLSHDGKFEEIKEFLRDPLILNVNVTDSRGSFSLLEATLTWDMGIINYLLDCGADINHVTDEGISCLGSCMLFYYPQRGFIETIAESIVVLNQTPLNYPGVRRETFKTYSSVESNEIAKPNPENASNIKSSKPLNSQENNNLVDENNKMEEWNHYQMSSIELNSNSIRPINSLLNTENVDEVNDENSQNFESFRNYIEYPIKVNDNLLEKAATILSLNSMIINRQPRPNSCFQDVSTEEGVARFKALKISRFNQMLQVIQLLLRRGANPNVCQVPFSALFFAVKSGDIEMTKLLINKGADLNASLKTQDCVINLLHVPVCLPGHIGITITNLLLQSGADPNARALEDDSFLDKTLIDEWSKDVFTDEQIALMGGKTPLHLVCSRYDDFKVSHTIARLLLTYGADPNLLCNGHTALTLAIASGNDLIVDEILNSPKLNINLPLTHGLGNALCVALSTSFEHTRPIESRLALIKKLISFGADPLAPVSIGVKRTQGIVIDYAYYIFNLDQRVAHLPYHALTSVERELFNNRRTMLSNMSMFTREAAVEKEKQRLLTIKEEGGEDRTPSPDFVYTGSGAVPVTVPTAAVETSSVISKTSRNLTNIESQMQGAELLARRPLLKYCYECGRSVHVKLTACTRCKEVYFCSKLCKTKAWTARHKSECLRVGVRITSAGSDHKSNRNIDSPTPATVADDLNILEQKTKNQSKIISKKDPSQLKEKMNTEIPQSNTENRQTNYPRRLPPLNFPSHPSYSYSYITGQYVKIDNLGRLLPLNEGVMDNYSFE